MCLLGRNVYSDPLVAKVKVAQSCPTLWDSMDCIISGILQARILDWVAFPFSRVFSQPRDQCHFKGGRQKYFLTNKIKILKSNPGNSILNAIKLKQNINWNFYEKQNDRIPFVIEVISRKFL